MKAFVIALTLVLTACNTPEVGVSIQEKSYSLAEIKTAIVSISGDPREKSQNQREYLSQYFSKTKEANFNPQSSKERSFAHFLILGERRPYEIKVIVYTERKTPKGYVRLGEDRAWSKKISEELAERLLHNSRDGRNVIDDFRPF